MKTFLSKNTFLLFMMAFSLNASAGFWDGIRDFFRDLGAALSGQGVSTGTIDPNAGMGTLTPVRPPCLAQIDQTSLPEDEQQWLSMGFQNPDINMIQTDIENLLPDTEFSHEIELSAVVFRDAGWDAAAIHDRMQRVARVLAQCGIKLSQYKSINVRPRNGNVDIDFRHNVQGSVGIDRNGGIPSDSYYRNLVESYPETNRPLITFARQNTGSANHAFGLLGTNSPSANTAAVMSTVQSNSHPSSPPGSNNDYSSIAHEVAHMLCQCGHVDGENRDIENYGQPIPRPNLLGPGSGLSGDLHQSQCQTFKELGTRNGLLTRIE